MAGRQLFPASTDRLHSPPCRWGDNGVDEGLDHVAELFGDPVADHLGVLEIGREEVPKVKGRADAEEDVSVGQAVGPVDPVDLALQLEDHFRQPLLRRVQIHVRRLPAPHSGDALQPRQVVAEPLTTGGAEFPPPSQQLAKVGTEPPDPIHHLGLGVDRHTGVMPLHYVGREVEVRVCSGRVQVVDPKTTAVMLSYPRQTPERILMDEACYQGRGTDRVAPPKPLGRMARKLQEIAALPVERRPVDLYAALAEVAR
jgi:hypothetical protein